MGASTGNWINMVEAGGLQAALESLPKGGGTIYVGLGRHEIAGPVSKELAEGQHLFIIGEGRGSVLVNTNKSGGPLLQISGVTGSWWPDLRMTFRDLAFEGNHQSGDGLILMFPNDALVDTCFFLGHGGHAVRLTPHGTNVVVRDCWMRDCKRGVRAENIHHLTLHGNQTRRLAGGQEQEEHVYLSWDCREVRIVNNHFAYGTKSAIILDGTAQHVISNNTIEGFETAIEARGSCDQKVRDRCRDIAITSNYLHADIGIRLMGECRGFAVTGNDFINNTRAAVLIEGATGAGKHTLTGNIVRKSVYGGAFFPLPKAVPQQGGIVLGDAEGCVVTGNLLDAIDPGPAISAGPGGGGHVIANNRITAKGQPLDIRAAACVVEHNLST